MAFDEWMLQSAAKTPGGLFVRLYTWQVGTITFGYNQRRETAMDFGALGDTPVIRRVTGGRAVYHDISELTYALAFNAATPPCPALTGSGGETSEMIARMLSGFLERFGIASDWVKRSSSRNARPEYFHKAACFDSHAKYELTAGQSKIVASARRDWNGAALQHGSIKLYGLAPHPALKVDSVYPLAPTKSIDASELKDLTKAFAESVRDVFGLSVTESIPAQSDLVEIESRRIQVEQRPTDRRDLIAQSSVLLSL